ncbi:35889_t:CDS:1, partial [Racocetra persica]
NESSNARKFVSISSRTRHRRREREIQSSQNILHGIPLTNIQTSNISNYDMPTDSRLESHKTNIPEFTSNFSFSTLSSLLKNKNTSELELEEADELELEKADKMELELNDVNEQESLPFILLNSSNETSDILTDKTFMEFDSDDQGSELDEENSNDRPIPEI